MIQFTCPSGKALHAQDEHAGQTTRCPACGRDLAIPDAAGVQPADAPRSPGRPRDEALRERPDRPGGDREDRTRAPSTSRMAVGGMVLGLLSLFCNLWTALPALVLGAIALWDIGRSEGRKKGKGLAITGIVTAVVLPILAFLIVQRVQEAAAKISSKNNLMQIDLALHDYNDAMTALPSAALCDTNGKPLLSWRVAILPYIEKQDLYVQFKLDEPWDGPHNSKLLSQMPKYYALPGDTTAPPGYTYYRVFVSKDANSRPNPAFDWCKGVSMADGFQDGAANTILVVEAATAVPWTKPEELDYDPDGPLPPLGGHFSGGFHVALGGVNVRFIPSSISPQTLRAAITRNGGDTLGPDW